MTPDELRNAITEIHGPTGQRAMSRHLTESGILADRDGSRLRKMLAGSRPILPEVVAEISHRLERARAVRGRQNWVERVIFDIREKFPKASLIYAQIVLRLDRGPAYLRDLCVDIGDDANSSAVSKAVLRLEEMGIAVVDRGNAKQEGYSISLVKSIPVVSRRTPPPPDPAAAARPAD